MDIYVVHLQCSALLGIEYTTSALHDHGIFILGWSESKELKRIFKGTWQVLGGPSRDISGGGGECEPPSQKYNAIQCYSLITPRPWTNRLRSLMRREQYRKWRVQISSLITCVFVAAILFLASRCLAKLGEILQSRWLVTRGGYKCRHRDWWGIYNMQYAVEMDTDALIYMPIWINFVSATQIW
jgi:hypothetical protein